MICWFSLIYKYKWRVSIFLIVAGSGSCCWEKHLSLKLKGMYENHLSRLFFTFWILTSLSLCLLLEVTSVAENVGAMDLATMIIQRIMTNPVVKCHSSSKVDSFCSNHYHHHSSCRTSYFNHFFKSSSSTDLEQKKRGKKKLC